MEDNTLDGGQIKIERRKALELDWSKSNALRAKKVVIDNELWVQFIGVLFLTRKYYGVVLSLVYIFLLVCFSLFYETSNHGGKGLVPALVNGALLGGLAFLFVHVIFFAIINLIYFYWLESKKKLFLVNYIHRRTQYILGINTQEGEWGALGSKEAALYNKSTINAFRLHRFRLGTPTRDIYSYSICIEFQNNSWESVRVYSQRILGNPTEQQLAEIEQNWQAVVAQINDYFGFYPASTDIVYLKM